MFLRELAVFALLSSVLGHHLGTSYKHRHDDRSVNPGCTCEDSSTRQAFLLLWWNFLTSLSSYVAPSSSAAGIESTTSAPTPTPTTTVNDATEFTSSASTTIIAAIYSTTSASTTAPDSTMSPTKSTDTSESSTSAPSYQCSSTPINGCANSRNIIAQSSLTKGDNCFSRCSKNIDCRGYVVGTDTDGHYRCDLLKASGEMDWDQDLTESNPDLCHRYFIYDFKCVDDYSFP